MPPSTCFSNRASMYWSGFVMHLRPHGQRAWRPQSPHLDGSTLPEWPGSLDPSVFRRGAQKHYCDACKTSKTLSGHSGVCWRRILRHRARSVISTRRGRAARTSLASTASACCTPRRPPRFEPPGKINRVTVKHGHTLPPTHMYPPAPSSAGFANLHDLKGPRIT